MLADTVTQAVKTLRERGERLSVRNLHGLVGGSFRDLSRLLKDHREFFADDDIEDLDAEVSESPTPASLGQIAAMFEAARASEAAAGEASVVLDATRERLRTLLARQILPATDPHDVASVVTARRERAGQVAQLQDEITQLEKLVEQHMMGARAQRQQGQGLEARARELRSSLIPSRRTFNSGGHDDRHAQ
jgi:hypothetical protein